MTKYFHAYSLPQKNVDFMVISYRTNKVSHLIANQFRDNLFTTIALENPKDRTLWIVGR